MKQCAICHEWKEETEFNWRYKVLGVRYPTCRDCHKGFRKNRYEGDAHDRHLQTVKERTIAARDAAESTSGNISQIIPALNVESLILSFWNFTTGMGKTKASAI